MTWKDVGILQPDLISACVKSLRLRWMTDRLFDLNQVRYLHPESPIKLSPVSLIFYRFGVIDTHPN